MQFCNEQIGPSHYFHLHARAPPTAVLKCVDERIGEGGNGQWVDCN